MNKVKYILKALGSISESIEILQRLKNEEKIEGFSICDKCNGSTFGKGLNICMECEGRGFKINGTK